MRKVDTIKIFPTYIAANSNSDPTTTRYDNVNRNCNSRESPHALMDFTNISSVNLAPYNFKKLDKYFQLFLNFLEVGPYQAINKYEDRRGGWLPDTLQPIIYFQRELMRFSLFGILSHNNYPFRGDGGATEQRLNFPLSQYRDEDYSGIEFPHSPPFSPVESNSSFESVQDAGSQSNPDLRQEGTPNNSEIPPDSPSRMRELENSENSSSETPVARLSRPRLNVPIFNDEETERNQSHPSHSPEMNPPYLRGRPPYRLDSPPYHRDENLSSHPYSSPLSYPGQIYSRSSPIPGTYSPTYSPTFEESSIYRPEERDLVNSDHPSLLNSPGYYSPNSPMYSPEEGELENSDLHSLLNSPRYYSPNSPMHNSQSPPSIRNNFSPQISNRSNVDSPEPEIDNSLGDKSLTRNIITFLSEHSQLLSHIYQLHQESYEWRNSLTSIEKQFIEESPSFVDKPFTRIEDTPLVDIWDGTSIGWLSKETLNSKQGLGRPVYVYEVILYRYLVYLSAKIYGRDAFIAKSDRVLNYFEYQGSELINFQNSNNIDGVVANQQFGDLFYFRAYNLFTAKSLVVPIFYQNYLTKSDYQVKFELVPLTNWDYLNHGPGLQFDIINLPQYFKFQYVNYNIEQKLILGKAVWATMPVEDSSYPSPEKIKLRSSKLYGVFYFYLSWDDVVSNWTKPIDTEVGKNDDYSQLEGTYIPFISEKYNDLNFYLDYRIWDRPSSNSKKYKSYSLDSWIYETNPTVTNISKSEIVKVINQSGLAPNSDNYPLTNTYYYQDDKFQTPRKYRKHLNLFTSEENHMSAYRAQELKYLMKPSTLLTTPLLRLMLLEYWNYFLVKRSDAVNLIDKYGTRQLLLNSSQFQHEWQYICSYLGKSSITKKLSKSQATVQYDLNRLHTIAIDTFNLDQESITKLSKRELCALLAKLTVKSQKTVVERWLNQRALHPVPKLICNNYSDSPILTSSIAKLEKKLYHPETHILTDGEFETLARFASDELGISSRQLGEMGLVSNNIKGWRTVIEQYHEKTPSFNESDADSFIVVVKPDLTSRCISVTTITQSKKTPLCKWGFELESDNESKKDMGLDGEFIKPLWKSRRYQTEDLRTSVKDFTTLYQVPFPIDDPALKGISNLKETIYINKHDMELLKKKIKANQKTSPNRVLVVYLGEISETGRIGNCQGTRDASELHGQLHSNSPFAKIIYFRHLDIKKHKDENASEFQNKPDTPRENHDASVPSENPQIKAELGEINKEEAVIIRRINHLTSKNVSNRHGDVSIEDARIQYQASSSDENSGEIMISEEDFIKDVYPNLVDILDELHSLAKEQRSLAIRKMRLRPLLYKPTD